MIMVLKSMFFSDLLLDLMDDRVRGGGEDLRRRGGTRDVERRRTKEISATEVVKSEVEVEEERRRRKEESG